MEQELQKTRTKLDEQAVKLDEIYRSVEKLRKYFKWTMIITIIVVVLPLIGLVFALPAFLNNYIGQLNSISGF